MTTRYFKDLFEYATSDVVIVGAGPSGLACAYELSKNPDLKVTLKSEMTRTHWNAFFADCDY